MALRIGPVGPVREAGLGSGAGLGSEVLSCAVTGDAVCPRAPEPSVTAHPQCLLCSGGGDPFQMRPRVALTFYQLAGAAAVLLRSPGSQRRAASTVRVVWAPKGPGAALPFAPGLPPPSARKPVRRASASVGDQPQGFTQRRSQRETRSNAAWEDGPACRGVCFGGGGCSPLATRAESSDRRVSGPSVERARLRGRGGSGSLSGRLSKAVP